MRVRSVHGRCEIDAKLWANLLGDGVAERITVSESDDCWFQYVLNSEGLDSVNSFVSIHRVADALPLVPGINAHHEDVSASASSTSTATTVTLGLSQKEIEVKASKRAMLSLVGVMTCDNEIIISSLAINMAVSPFSLGKTPEGNFLRVVGIHLQASGESSVKAVRQLPLLWLLLTARFSDVFETLPTGQRDGVSLLDMADNNLANITSAAGLAGCWESFIRIMKRLSGSGGEHFLQRYCGDFIGALRNNSSEEGALGNCPLPYLLQLNGKIWMKLGLAIDDHSRLGDKEAFFSVLKSLFCFESQSLEYDLARWHRSTNLKRKQADEEAKVARAKTDLSSARPGSGNQTGRGAGGGGGRGGGGGGRSFSVGAPAIGQLTGGRGGRSQGRGLAPRGPQDVCMTNLQHLLMPQALPCSRRVCSFSHAPINLVDRSAAKITAAKVVTDQGRLTSLLARLNDISLKFLGE